MNFLRKNKKTIAICLFYLIVFTLGASQLYGSLGIAWAQTQTENVKTSTEAWGENSKTAVENAQDAADSKGSWVAGILSWIFMGLTNMLGILTAAIMTIVNNLFKYDISNFNEAINKGWVIVRDLCNMFFILILLIIAFATILRRESYSAKSLLPKLLIMAVLINFSQTISFLMIDFSQIVMLTFANSFAANNASGNFVQHFGLDKLMKLSNCSKVSLSDGGWGLFSAIALSFFVMVIVVIIMIMIAAMLIMRLIMFVVLVILSPIAFFASVLPATQKYASQWWEHMGKNLVSGPVLAFFVWLALSLTAPSSSYSTDLAAAIANCSDSTSSSELRGLMTQFGKWENLQGFIVAIALLVGSMKMAQTMGVAGGNIGMNLANKMKDKGTAMARKGAVNAGKFTSRNTLRATGAGLGLVGGALDRKANKRDADGNLQAGTISKIGALGSAWGNGMRTKRREEKRKSREKIFEKMGMDANTMDAMETVRQDSKVQHGLRVAKGAAVGAAIMASGGSLAPVLAGGAIAGAYSGVKQRIGQGMSNFNQSNVQNRQKELDIAAQTRDNNMNVLDASSNAYAREKRQHNNRLNIIEKSRQSELNDVDNPSLFTRNAGETNQKYEERKQYEKDQINKKKDSSIAIEKELHQSIVDNKTNPVMVAARQDYNNQRNQILGDHDREAADINFRYLETRGFQHVADSLQNSRVGELTGEALRNGSKEVRQAAQKRDVLGTSSLDFKNFSGNSFYNQAGPSSSINRLFDVLANGSNESIGAINNMTRVLQAALNTGVNRLSQVEKNNLLQLKQGIAAQAAGGQSVGHLQPVINILNQMDVGENNATVDELQKKVVSR